MRRVGPLARHDGKRGCRLSVDVALDGGVAVVTIDRQDALNALDVPTLTELRDRLREIESDAGVRAVVLTGAGEKAFVAGADIKYMSGLDAERAKGWGALGHETARELAAKSTLALALAKRLCNLTLGVDHADGLEVEAREFGALFASADAREGLAAFVEKRAPSFSGR